MNIKNYQKAIFAAGCFWGVEQSFSKMRGVVSTRVGYTGGKTADPTYDDVCSKGTGHAEAVEVIFDPEIVSYENLLAMFFSLHSPGSVVMQGKNNSSQYRGAVFYFDQIQKEIIDAEIDKLESEKKYGSKIYTQVAPAQTFWQAEDYHQKYYKNG